MEREHDRSRLDRLEEKFEVMDDHITKLNTTLALLNQTVENMHKAQDKRQALADKSLLFVIGGVISAVIAWIVRGGLGA